MYNFACEQGQPSLLIAALTAGDVHQRQKSKHKTQFETDSSSIAGAAGMMSVVSVNGWMTSARPMHGCSAEAIQPACISHKRVVMIN